VSFFDDITEMVRTATNSARLGQRGEAVHLSRWTDADALAEPRLRMIDLAGGIRSVLSALQLGGRLFRLQTFGRRISASFFRCPVPRFFAAVWMSFDHADYRPAGSASESLPVMTRSQRTSALERTLQSARALAQRGDYSEVLRSIEAVDAVTVRRDDEDEIMRQAWLMAATVRVVG
jgi:hypothetical protein